MVGVGERDVEYVVPRGIDLAQDASGAGAVETGDAPTHHAVPVAVATEAAGRVALGVDRRYELEHRLRGTGREVQRELDTRGRRGVERLVVEEADVAVGQIAGVMLGVDRTLRIVLDRDDLSAVLVRRLSPKLPHDLAVGATDVEHRVGVTHR